MTLYKDLLFTPPTLVFFAILYAFQRFENARQSLKMFLAKILSNPQSFRRKMFEIEDLISGKDVHYDTISFTVNMIKRKMFKV